MQKKNYLSRDEQTLYATLQRVDVITHDHIKELFPEYSFQKINKLCHNLLVKGYLYPLKRGLYLINEIPSDHPIVKNPFHIASSLHKGYLGFSSALRLYDLIDYESFTIFTITRKKSSETTIGNYLFKTVSMGQKATGATFYKNTYVSTIEKTLFDCFYKPQYAGGYQEIIKALEQMKKIDWTQVLQYFTTFGSDALCQRTGYILDCMHDNHSVHVPKIVLDTFKKRIRNTTKLLPSGSPHGRYVKEWKLLDNQGQHILNAR